MLAIHALQGEIRPLYVADAKLFACVVTEIELGKVAVQISGPKRSLQAPPSLSPAFAELPKHEGPTAKLRHRTFWRFP